LWWLCREDGGEQTKMGVEVGQRQKKNLVRELHTKTGGWGKEKKEVWVKLSKMGRLYYYS